ncbi:hypothetical protein [Streptomyces avermitilis]|uniref:hypothetical protein n=1 Tax=Streptomyces avermitilis TaxID=33903 RepID=UPI0036C8DB5D
MSVAACTCRLDGAGGVIGSAPGGRACSGQLVTGSGQLVTGSGQLVACWWPARANS